MSSDSLYPLSNTFTRSSATGRSQPNRSFIQRSHLEEIRRQINECIADGCPCGASLLYDKLDSLERHHGKSTGQYLNVRQTKGCYIQIGVLTYVQMITQRPIEPAESAE